MFLFYQFYKQFSFVSTKTHLDLSAMSFSPLDIPVHTSRDPSLLYHFSLGAMCKVHFLNTWKTK